jgi:hypothetical protein
VGEEKRNEEERYRKGEEAGRGRGGRKGEKRRVRKWEEEEGGGEE